jgi:hypothetical protein
MKLAEIASAIDKHLKRFEADPEINQYKDAIRYQDKLHPYWKSGAWAAGRYVYVSYVSYQGSSHLTKDEAMTYLVWLNSGNVGRHYGALELRGKP